MGIAKPTGGYAEQMVNSGAWPEADEDIFYDRAQEWTRVLRQVTDVLESCQRQQAEIFDGGVWSGGAASAANGELGSNIDDLVTLQNGLASIITWQRHIASSIVQVKSHIGDNVELAHQRIQAIANDSALEDDDRVTAIRELISEARGVNADAVAGAAEQILSSKSWKPPFNALRELLDQKIPPPVSLSVAPQAPSSDYDPDQSGPTQGAPPPSSAGPGTVPDSGATPTPGDSPGPTPGAGPTPGLPDGSSPGGTPSDSRPTGPDDTKDDKTPVAPGPFIPSVPKPAERPKQTPAAGLTPAPTPAPGSGTQPSPLVPPSPAPTPSPTSPSGPAGPSVPSGPAGPSVPSGPGVPLSPAASTQPAAAPGETGRGVAPASVAVSQHASRSTEETSSSASAGAGGIPAAPMGAGAGGGGGSTRPSGPSSSPGDKPSSDKPAPSTRPAAARNAATARPSDSDKPAFARQDTEIPKVAEAAAAMIPIPVAAALAERDAIADAATAEAARRKGDDPLRLGRRIAAALNAPGNFRPGDLGFFWVTAVTTDGSIVVANSYGLAFIPDGVQLPDKVHLASADDAIPAAERATWATYPVLAVQGWAAHHDRKLRAVIGTEEHLGNSDAGVPKVLLQPDEIPDNGEMIGRSRLEVVHPDAAEKLAETTDPRLLDLLPPAPVAAPPPVAGTPPPAPEEPKEPRRGPRGMPPALAALEKALAQTPPAPTPAGQKADERAGLWFDVSKPLASSHPGRQAVHLRAFRTYAAYAQEFSLSEAHTVTDPVAQRAAVTEWMYWKYLTELMDAALADASGQPKVAAEV